MPTKRTRTPRFSGYLPSGLLVRDVRRYIAVWRNLAEPCERILGLRVYGYEPGIGATPISIPTPIAIRLWEYDHKRKWSE